MSKIINNPLLTGASGKLGNTVVYRTINGKVQMANKPRPRKQNSPAQEEAKIEFLLARNYAKKQVDNPEFKAVYTKGITPTKRTAYQVAMMDYFNPPQVRAIDAVEYQGKIGDEIKLVAYDDFMITKVIVAITDPNGVQLERGEAQVADIEANRWSYKAAAANASVTGSTIKVTAYDRPGNSGELVKVL
jgi:hypothetical protein